MVLIGKMRIPTRVVIATFKCPACGARKHYPCTSLRTNIVIQQPHAARRALFKRGGLRS
jgi:predicted RNA-binding Zn-ribbon protein involved in translation (DUF1610 family)